jgi:two-component system, OmpR family, alkaline phosphatase synthesis response regulator PhoP
MEPQTFVNNTMSSFSAQPQVLVIEDESDIRELLKFNLEREGYATTVAASGEEGLKLAQQIGVNLVILDLMLPGIDGFEVCRALKSDPRTRHIPVVMLTAKGSESDIVAGLELGADDFIPKPFSPRELIARVRARLRSRASHVADESELLSLGGITINSGQHIVSIDGTTADLTLTEYQILHLLARRPGWVFSRAQIVNSVRGQETIITDRAIDVQIVGIRKKLGKYGKYIETVRGVGYRMRRTPNSVNGN